VFLDWLTAVVQTSGVVASAIMLALLTFLVKFGFYRKFDQIDVIVGISEIPAILSATCGSLLVAALYLLSKDTRLVANYLILSFIVLLFNFFCFRFIESRKLSLSEQRLINLVVVCFSYFLMGVFSVAATVRAYGDLAA
jgi:uncharacterized membrane protein (UPF0136 family)